MSLSTLNSVNSTCSSWDGQYENVLSYTNYYIEIKNNVNFTLFISQTNDISENPILVQTDYIAQSGIVLLTNKITCKFFKLSASSNQTGNLYISTLYKTVSGTGPQGPEGPQGPTGPAPSFQNFLSVAKNGNDTNPSPSYLTITAALSVAQSGQTVYVYPGVYDEKNLTIGSNVSLRGVSVQTVIIQPSDMTGANSVVVMSDNTRIEDVTITLNSNINQNTYGISIPGDPTTIKIRTCVINVTSSAGTNTNNIAGVFSSGSTANPTTPRSSNAIRASTINVTANSSAPIARGIYVTGASNFCCRDTNVYVSGSATNIIGVETTNSSSYVQLKTSSISGSLYDVKQPLLSSSAPSCLELAATDLINNNADDNGFSTKIDPTQIYYCIQSTLSQDTTHYLLPGSIALNQASNNIIGLLIIQKCILFQGGCLMQHETPIESGRFLTVNIYSSTSPTSKSSPTPFHTFTLTGDGVSTSISSTFKNKSKTFANNLYLIVEIVVPPNPNVPTIDAFVLTLDFY